MGVLAGWGFVVGKTASCAAMALTVGHYAAPGYAPLIAVATVAVLSALNYTGVQKSATLTRAIVAFVLVTLAAVVAAAAFSATPQPTGTWSRWAGPHSPGCCKEAAFLFFAFAGYARIATLGEEVRDPVRTIPRAISLALGVALTVYAAVAVALLAVLGPEGIAASSAPLAAAARASGWGWVEPLVRVGAVVAAVGSLLSLLLGVSRTTLAMARDGHLPRTLAAVHPRHRVPHHAELAVGAVVMAVVLVADVRSAIGFSSLPSWPTTPSPTHPRSPCGPQPRRPRAHRRPCRVRGPRRQPPRASTVAGVGVLALGAVVWWVRGRRTQQGTAS